jgi:hypothetical protein
VGAAVFHLGTATANFDRLKRVAQACETQVKSTVGATVGATRQSHGWSHTSEPRLEPHVRATVGARFRRAPARDERAEDGVEGTQIGTGRPPQGPTQTYIPTMRAWGSGGEE